MNWKNQRENAYPSIILSDCLVDDIKICDNDVIIKFLTNGFIIEENAQYYHTKAAQVIFKQCDTEDISVQIVYNKKGIFGNKREIQDLDTAVFIENISNRKWSCEIVEEYYSALGGLFVGQIREVKAKMWCCVKLQFERMIYSWDEVDHDFQVW